MKKKINSFVEIANEEVFSINGEINNLHEMLKIQDLFKYDYNINSPFDYGKIEIIDNI